MKKNIFLVLCCLALCFDARSQLICNPNGSIVLFTNYDGGTLNIDVDVNIPNLKIGVVTYEAVSINLTGAFVNNVSAVYYAGYNSPNNTNCNPAVPTTVINGAPAAATTTIQFAPNSPLANPNGYPSIICGYTCDVNTPQGGCNTIDQIEAFFNAQFPGTSIRSHKVQYNCWQGTHTVSGGGTCCLAAGVPMTGAVSYILPSCPGACDGSIAAVVTGGTPPYAYQWVGGPATPIWNNLCAGTYTILISDAAANSLTLTANLANPAAITTTLTQSACFSYNFNGTTLTNSGTYTDTMQAANGCDSLITLNLTILNVNTNVTQAGAVLTAGVAGATYKWLNCMTQQLIPGATAQSYTATQTGSYAVIITLNGCTDTSSCYNVSVSGIDEHANAALNFYPNPVMDELSIEIPAGFEESVCIIRDASGRVVWKQELRGGRVSVNTNSWSKGVYVAEVEGVRTRYKIVK